MLQVNFLGTGNGAPTSGRFHSSFLLSEGKSHLLVDAGEPCSHRLAALGFSLCDLDAVLISHGHSDHIGGLPMLLQGCWLQKRTRPLPIHLPAELIAALTAWLEAVYLPPSLLGFDLQFIPWTEGVSVMAGKVEVSIATSTHLVGLGQIIDPNATDRFKAYSLALNTGTHRIVYSADLGAPEDLDPQLTSPCDLLICELSHFSSSELFSYLASKRGIKRLTLTHLDSALWESREQILTTARSALPEISHIEIAQDGGMMEI